MSGASRRLRQIIDRFEPDFKMFKREIQPRIQKLRWDSYSSAISNERFKLRN